MSTATAPHVDEIWFQQHLQHVCEMSVLFYILVSRRQKMKFTSVYKNILIICANKQHICFQPCVIDTSHTFYLTQDFQNQIWVSVTHKHCHLSIQASGCRSGTHIRAGSAPHMAAQKNSSCAWIFVGFGIGCPHLQDIRYKSPLKLRECLRN